jgi:hypothetical protein
MSGRDHEKLTMTCPKCKHTGVADTSTSDSMYAMTDSFHVDKFPPGFSLAKDGGGSQRKTDVLCKCGNTFKL